MTRRIATVLVCLLLLPSASSMAEENLLSSLGLTRPEGISNAPPFFLKDLNGSPGALTDYHGQVILLHFWATWCVPCRQELPVLHALWERLRSRGLVVVAIAGDSQEAVQPFVTQQGLKFPVLLDQYGSALRSYRVRALPMSYVVGKTGKIEWVAFGPVDWSADGVTRTIEALLNER